jgi:nitrile hydratase subunit beta
MNSVHDMGGMHNLGPIEHEGSEPLFHHEWERRALALNLATGALGQWNIDMSRHAREQMPAADYLASGYYEKWIWGLTKLLVDRGLVPQEEIDARMADLSAPVKRTGHPRLFTADKVDAALKRGNSAKLAVDVPARFKAGDRVKAIRINPTSHTRLPRYARGAAGVVDRDHGVHIFADTHAMGLGQKPQHLYSVRFAARELWGAEVPEQDAVYIDLWDDHLEPA